MRGEKYEHVPGWLARRCEFVAALEDNPVYLKVTGRRYARRRAVLPYELRSHLLLTLFVLAVLLLSIGLALPVLLILVLAVPASMNKMHKFLEQEWRSGWLKQVHLTRLSDAEIVWGYFAPLVLDQVRQIPPIFFAAAVLEVSLPEILNWLAEWRGAAPVRIPAPYPILIPVAVVLLAGGLHFALLSVYAAIHAIPAELHCIKTTIGRQARSLFANRFGLLAMLMVLLLPGVLAVTLFFEADVPRRFDFDRRFGDWSTGMTLMLCAGVYALVSYPYALHKIRRRVRTLEQQAERLYPAAIARLSNEGRHLPASRIFGEK